MIVCLTVFPFVGIPTVPTTVQLELDTNPFMRVDDEILRETAKVGQLSTYSYLSLGYWNNLFILQRPHNPY